MNSSATRQGLDPVGAGRKAAPNGEWRIGAVRRSLWTAEPVRKSATHVADRFGRFSPIGGTPGDERREGRAESDPMPPFAWNFAECAKSGASRNPAETSPATGGFRESTGIGAMLPTRFTRRPKHSAFATGPIFLAEQARPKTLGSCRRRTGRMRTWMRQRCSVADSIAATRRILKTPRTAWNRRGRSWKERVPRIPDIPSTDGLAASRNTASQPWRAL